MDGYVKWSLTKDVGSEMMAPKEMLMHLFPDPKDVVVPNIVKDLCRQG